MAISFIPEIWASVPLGVLEKSLVYAQAGVVNRDYEGEIRAGGDTVHIRSISDPTVSSYTKNSTVTYETLTDADRQLRIDQQKIFSFSVDDIDEAQASGALEQALTQAAYKLRDTADQYVAGLYTGAASANQIGTVSVTTAPEKTTLDWSDNTVSSGMRALRRAWRQMTIRSRRPLARAVRM